jgi:hypothetical protein
MGEYLHNVILGRMYQHSAPKYPDKIKIRDKNDGKVFDCTYGGYDPRRDRHLYSLCDVNTGECYYETPEGYITGKCEIITE